MEHKKFTLVVIAVVTSLLLAGTNLAPTLAYAQSFTDQNINEENLCFRSNICRQSDIGQNTLGNDNQKTAFADQSDNLQQSTTANNTTPTPTPTLTTGTLTVLKIVSGTTTATPSNFTIHVTGNNPTPANFAGSSTGIDVTLSPGAFNVTETGPTSSFNTATTADCAGTIAAGQHLTCTITNTAKTCEECFTSLLTPAQLAAFLQVQRLTLDQFCEDLGSIHVSEMVLRVQLTSAGVGVSVTTANELIACLKAAGIVFAP